MEKYTLKKRIIFALLFGLIPLLILGAITNPESFLGDILIAFALVAIFWALIGSGIGILFLIDWIETARKKSKYGPDWNYPQF